MTDKIMPHVQEDGRAPQVESTSRRAGGDGATGEKRRPPENRQPGPPASGAPPAPPAAPPAPVTVLLAEDDPLVRDVAIRVLERAGHRVQACCDGREALDAFTARPQSFDLVLLDDRMPRLTGCEALDTMLRLRPEAKAILTSGYPVGPLPARLHGVVRFLPKPYQAADLLQMVADVIAAGPR